MELAKGTFPDMNDVLYIYIYIYICVCVCVCVCVCEYIIICFIC